MKNQPIDRNKFKNLLNEFKEEIKENKVDLKLHLINRRYQDAAYLQSINNCLDYVIHRLNREILCKQN